MRVRLLGPVDVIDDSEILPVSGLRRKAVLATLALHAGQVVGTGRLVDAVWGETAPAALNTLVLLVNLLPVAPSDGYALFRSALWAETGSRAEAERRAIAWSRACPLILGCPCPRFIPG